MNMLRKVEDLKLSSTRKHHIFTLTHSTIRERSAHTPSRYESKAPRTRGQLELIARLALSPSLTGRSCVRPGFDTGEEVSGCSAPLLLTRSVPWSLRHNPSFPLGPLVFEDLTVWCGSTTATKGDRSFQARRKIFNKRKRKRYTKRRLLRCTLVHSLLCAHD